MTINLVFQACSKYIELDYDFMCERVALRLFITQHVYINNQVLSSRHLHQLNQCPRPLSATFRTNPASYPDIVGGRVLAVAETRNLGVTGVVRLLEKNGETRMKTPANQRILMEIRWKTKEIQ
jgi:hypothetical protein